MPEPPLELVIPTDRFVRILEEQSEPLVRLTNALLATPNRTWNPKHYFQLVHHSNELESLLDDYGAKYNRDFHFLREVVASLRGFSQAGYSLAHMLGRLDSYSLDAGSLNDDLRPSLERSTREVASFTRTSVERLLAVFVEEARRLGMGITPEATPEEGLTAIVVREKLPRDLGVEEIEEEERRIAEVASKFLLAIQVLEGLSLRPIVEPEARSEFLARICTEEQARVYEATVHNLQSAYDTHIKNTVLESEDDRLPALRGLTSAALHLLEAVTFLTHFYERHESGQRGETASQRLAELIDRGSVQELILNQLLVTAASTLQAGKSLAEGLLSKFTNAQQLEVELGDGLLLHARPAALIVGIVNHHGTPVSMEVGGQVCNAASILELLLTVGSHPDERSYLFRGDANPLRDIGLLFQHGLGEDGVDHLPSELDYLRAK